MRLVSVMINLVNLFIGTVLTILGLRFVLRLFGASDSAAFVSWIYEMSATLLQPFRGIFPTQTFENNVVLEFSTLFAMIVYGLLGMLLIATIAALTPAPAPAKKRK
ncbi:hypothetical protein BH23PAT2_BH23PAT2_10430 [soil metagenome]